MNARAHFLLTAVSGMVGMLSLITLGLCRNWITENPVSGLSDEGIDQISVIIQTSIIASHLSRVAIGAFIVFFVLYWVSRRHTAAKN